MPLRTKRIILALGLAASSTLFADWCSGGGDGWFIECSSSSCTITVDQGDGTSRFYDGPRSWGALLCKD